MTASIAAAIYTAILIGAAWSDTRSRTIPNEFTSAAALLYVAQAMLTEGLTLHWLAHMATGAVVLVGAALAFARGWFGGGDAKLLAAAALWAGPEGLPLLLLVTALTGGAMATAALLALRRSAEPEALATYRLPYGVAIAAGGIAATLATTLAA